MVHHRLSTLMDFSQAHRHSHKDFFISISKTCMCSIELKLNWIKDERENVFTIDRHKMAYIDGTFDRIFGTFCNFASLSMTTYETISVCFLYSLRPLLSLSAYCLSQWILFLYIFFFAEVVFMLLTKSFHFILFFIFS